MEEPQGKKCPVCRELIAHATFEAILHRDIAQTVERFQNSESKSNWIARSESYFAIFKKKREKRVRIFGSNDPNCLDFLLPFIAVAVAALILIFRARSS
jgi:hypothetical protein